MARKLAVGEEPLFWVGSSYRAVYTVRFAQAVYVLHAFQKKSPRGRKTPQRDFEERYGKPKS